MDHPLALDAATCRRRPGFRSSARNGSRRRDCSRRGRDAVRCRRRASSRVGLERGVEPAAHFGRDRAGGRSVHRPYIEGFDGVESKQNGTGGSKGRRARCAVPGCREPGEFQAPLAAGQFRRAGRWRWLCLDHVREHNARYNFFDGMSADEIRRRSRRSRGGSGRPAPSPPTAPTRRRPGPTSPTRSTRSRRGSAETRARPRRRASARPSGRRWRCSGLATTPTGTRFASAIRSSSAAITPTATAATAATKPSSGG